MEDGPILGVVYDSNSYPMHNRIDKPTTRLTVCSLSSFDNILCISNELVLVELGRINILFEERIFSTCTINDSYYYTDNEKPCYHTSTYFSLYKS